jgi:tetratricopeptide (TPR) repeat protein
MADQPPSILDDAATHLDQAYRYEEQGAFENALRECDLAIGSDPDLPEAHNLRGIVLEGLGRKGEAIEAYHEALRLDPRFSNASKNLADLEKELLSSLLGKERARRVFWLRALGRACRILAWVFLSVQVLKLLATSYYQITQSYYYGYGNWSQEILPYLLPSLIEILVNGAVYFVILFALSIICVEIAELARKSVRS